MTGFTAHIKEAIRINRERKPYYAMVSKGGTRRLSNLLIALEILVLPIAKYYDLKAAKFNRAGIGVVKEDFAEMILKPAESKPSFMSDFTPSIYEKVLSKVKAYLFSVRGIKSIQVKKELSLEFLASINTIEQESRIHLAMLVHLVESVIKIAHNGTKYSLMSNGASEHLTLRLLRLHFFAIRFALLIDRMANKFHQQGIGIIKNDMPEIMVRKL